MVESIVLYTEEIDDLELATKELFDQAKDFILKKNSLAILYAEEETALSDLYRHLAKQWDFPIVGCTVKSMLLEPVGCSSIGISVMLMTANDVFFSAGMTYDLNLENHEEAIAHTYAGLKKQLPSEEKLILTYGVMAEKEEDIVGDEIVHALEKACGRPVPIFGGLASDGFSFSNARVLCNGETAIHRQVIVLMAGAIDPQYVAVNTIENKAHFTYRVTKSHRNQVLQLGDTTFLETLEHEHVATKLGNIFAYYLLTPFLMEVKDEDGSTYEIGRTLSTLDPNTGAGAFLGCVSEGSFITFGIININDVQESVKKACNDIIDKVASADSPHHTLLSVSCSARYLAMASNTNMEMDVCRGLLPKNFSFLGMYGNGEICPIQSLQSKKCRNMFHNFTFAFLAL